MLAISLNFRVYNPLGKTKDFLITKKVKVKVTKIRNNSRPSLNALKKIFLGEVDPQTHD